MYVLLWQHMINMYNMYKYVVVMACTSQCYTNRSIACNHSCLNICCPMVGTTAVGLYMCIYIHTPAAVQFLHGTPFIPPTASGHHM